MHSYIAQIFDELFASLVEIDPFEVKISEEEDGFGTSVFTEQQVYQELERVVDKVKFEYPIQHVTVNKTIDIITLDDDLPSTAQTNSEHTPMDEDIILVERVRHDLVLKAFFKMQQDSIQKITFVGMERLKDGNFKDLYTQGFIRKE